MDYTTQAPDDNKEEVKKRKNSDEKNHQTAF